MKVHAVIAARGGEGAKTRWGAALGAAERSDLIAAMLADMIQALAGCPAIDRTWVVTPTPALAEAARAAGVSVLFEAEPRGINAAFQAARAEIRKTAPAAVVAALPGDLPLLERAELETAIGRLVPGAVVIAPAVADGGTGAVIFHADAPFGFHFGPDSFRRHCEAAAAAGLAPVTVQAPSLGLDIDRPQDLDQVLARAPDGRTARLLHQFQRLTEAPR